MAHLAELKNDEGLFLESIDKFQRAIEIKPDFYQAWRYWGFALSGLAKQRNDKSLYAEGLERYRSAVVLDPTYSKTVLYPENELNPCYKPHALRRSSAPPPSPSQTLAKSDQRVHR